MSLSIETFPEPLKEAVVRLLFKKPSLDPSDLANYHLESNLSFQVKILERVMVEHLQVFLDYSSILYPFQSGFHPSRGTEIALVTLMDDL